MLSSKMSQPVKTRSSRPASGTNSFTFGERPSVRLPRRIVPICVSEPIGCDNPLRMDSTPATKVVATAPMPGIMTPSFPFAGAMRWSCSWSLPLEEFEDLNSTVDEFLVADFAALTRDVFTFAIFWLLPCRNCGMYANQTSSRIRRGSCKPRCLNPQESRFNGPSEHWLVIRAGDRARRSRDYRLLK